MLLVAVRLFLMRFLIGVSVLALAWLFMGRRIITVLDRIVTIPHASLPVNPLLFEAGTFMIGGRQMGTMGPGYTHADLRISEDSSHRQVLASGGRIFSLEREDGDHTSFTVERSVMSWPALFHFNFMTGKTPSWKRHLYYKLLWQKRSGAELEMVWRNEQWFYSPEGWASGGMTTEDSTGLMRVQVTGAANVRNELGDQ